MTVQSFNLFEATRNQETVSSLESESPLIKQIAEALLFASQEPLSFQKIREIITEFHPVPAQTLRQALLELAIEYEKENRAFSLVEVANGFSLRTKKSFGCYLELLLRDRRSEKLSQAAAEVLAIIAYRQPITRPQIEAIRGVDCSGVVQTLLERRLIMPTGKLETPGRPTLYGTTKEFLCHFGLRDVSELPSLQ